MSGQHLSVSLVSRLDTSRRIDFSDDGWYLRKLDGWDDLPDRKSVSQSLALSHGSTQVDDMRRDAISGSLAARFRGSAEAVAAANIRLLALCSEPLKMWVTDHDGIARCRDVQVESIAVPDRHFPDTMVSASITWTAADPRRYSPMVPVTRGRVHNHGTAPTSPVLVVTGPVGSGVTVTEVETGRATRWAGSLQAGQELRLDPASGFATVDGKVVMGLRRAEWPLIPPGEARSYQATAGKLTVEHRSGWW